MAEGAVLLTDYLGFSGRLEFGREGPDAVQRMRSGVLADPIRVAGDVHLMLSGPIKGPVTQAWTQRLVTALRQGNYSDLARIPGELCGCVVVQGAVFLFRGVESTEALLHRRNGRTVRWSTDPTDLLDYGGGEFGDESLWRTCRGDEVFVYDDLHPVGPGEVVILDERRTTTVRFDPLPALDLPRRTTLPQYAELAYELLLEEARSYLGAGRVGLMLSGGLDSAAVLTAFAEVGVDVVVYHLVLNDRLADESEYARMVCDHLGTPLVVLDADYRGDFLPTGRRLPHPYLNPGLRWLEEFADRVRQDGVTHLVWGRDGDTQFGPVTFGLADALFGDLRLRDKALLCAGLVSSHWELPVVLASVRRSVSLLDEAASGEERATDFLLPAGDIPQQRAEEVPAFDVKDLCANLMVWRPRDIVMCNPLGCRDIQRLAKRMPNAYRMLVHRGQLISKPVLRAMLSTRLPAPVWRRTGRSWLDCVAQRYTAADRQTLLDLVGGPESRLVRCGIVDPRRLREVLADPHQRNRNAETLLNTAMTELFLRSYDNGPEFTAATGGEEHGAPRAHG